MDANTVITTVQSTPRNATNMLRSPVRTVKVLNQVEAEELVASGFKAQQTKLLSSDHPWYKHQKLVNWNNGTSSYMTFLPTARV